MLWMPSALWVQQSPHGAYTPAWRDARCRCYKTRPDCPGCRGWRHWAVRPQFIAVVCLFCSPQAGYRRDIHWTSTDSSQHSCLLCLPNGWQGLDMLASYDIELHAILDCAIPARTVTCRPLAGIPTFKNRRLQSVLNAAAKAKLIYRSSRHEHDIRILLQDLHWLWSREHIDFKLAVLVYRWLHVIAPPYDPISVWSLPTCRQLESPTTSFIIIIIVTDLYVAYIMWNVQPWCSMLGKTDLTGRILKSACRKSSVIYDISTMKPMSSGSLGLTGNNQCSH